MKKSVFKVMAVINKVVLSSFGKRDLTKLSKFEKAMVAYRYWVTTNALD